MQLFYVYYVTCQWSLDKNSIHFIFRQMCDPFEEIIEILAGRGQKKIK